MAYRGTLQPDGTFLPQGHPIHVSNVFEQDGVTVAKTVNVVTLETVIIPVCELVRVPISDMEHISILATSLMIHLVNPTVHSTAKAARN